MAPSIKKKGISSEREKQSSRRKPLWYSIDIAESAASSIWSSYDQSSHVRDLRGRVIYTTL